MIISIFLVETMLIGLLSFASIAVQQQGALRPKVMFHVIALTIAMISALNFHLLRGDCWCQAATTSTVFSEWKCELL